MMVMTCDGDDCDGDDDSNDSNDSFISHFSHLCDKILDENNLKEKKMFLPTDSEGLVLACLHTLGQNILVKEACGGGGKRKGLLWLCLKLLFRDALTKATLRR